MNPCYSALGKLRPVALHCAVCLNGCMCEPLTVGHKLPLCSIVSRSNMLPYRILLPLKADLQIQDFIIIIVTNNIVVTNRTIPISCLARFEHIFSFTFNC